MLIGLTQLHDKLVFIASRPKLSVIANQSADWFAMTGNLQRNLSNTNLAISSQKPAV